MDKHAAMILIVSAAVTGCATTAERSAKLEQEIEQMIQEYAPACEKLGYQHNSDPWRDCILHLNAKDEFEAYMMRYPNGFRIRRFP